MITISIIAVTVIVSLLCFNNKALFDKLCLNPYVMNRDRNEYFRFISSGFVHGDIGHLAFNMLTLWFFGRSVEGSVFTELQFVLFYFTAMVLSALPEFQKQKKNPDYRACGASGAISAVLFSLALYEPWGIVYIKFIIPVYFILFALFYLGYSLYKSRRQDDNIAHGVHLWGALYGIAFTLLVQPGSLSVFLDAVGHPPFLN